MSKKIAFFIGGMYGGGAERVISILANHYCSIGWNVDLVLLLSNKVEYVNIDPVHNKDGGAPGANIRPGFLYNPERVSLKEGIASARGYILSGDATYKDIYTENVKIALEKGELLRSLTYSEKFEQYSKMAEEWSDYVQTSVIDVYDAGEKELAKNNLIKMDSTASEIRKGFEELAASRYDNVNTYGTETISAGNKVKNISLAAGILILIFSIIIAISNANRISHPITAVTNRMKNIANGDLSEPPLEKTTEDEIGQLTDATNTMVLTFNHILNTIQQVASPDNHPTKTPSAEEKKQTTEQSSYTGKIAKIRYQTPPITGNNLSLKIVINDSNGTRVLRDGVAHSLEYISMNTRYQGTAKVTIYLGGEEVWHDKFN